MNFSLSLANNKLQGVQTNWSQPQELSIKITSPTSEAIPIPDPATEEQRLEARLVPTGISEKTRSAVLEQTQTQAQPQAQNLNKALANTPTAPKPPNPAAQAAALERQDASLAGLLLGSPEFQRR
jgi:hypothetical protein